MKKLLVVILFSNLNVFANEENRPEFASEIGKITDLNSTRTADMKNFFNKQLSASKKYYTDSSNLPPFKIDEELARKAMLCLTLPEDQRISCFSFQFYFYLALSLVECAPYVPDAPPICKEYAYYFDIAIRELGYLTEAKPY